MTAAHPLVSHTLQCGQSYVALQSRRPVTGVIHRKPALHIAQTSYGLNKTTTISGTPLGQNTSSKGFRRRCNSKICARVRDPDMEDEKTATKGPPPLLWKVISALTYLIPWIDTIALGREVYRSFPSLIWLYFFPGPSVTVYYSSQFAPLIIFFLLFLTIVKNTKLHHFVRFNCMQAVMLDIVCMLFHIVRAYFPAEVRWSNLLLWFDKFAFVSCMTTIIYCMYFTLRGKYANIPFVSESVYMQVDASEYA